MTVLDAATVRGQARGPNDDAQSRRARSGEGLSRREMMAATAAAGALGLLPAWVAPPVLASGTVFEDRSCTGQRRPGDPGIEGVLVSNGRDVVRTDADGRWQLALRDGESAFVIKPQHWSTPLGRGGIPDFSYLHQPEGSPRALALRYPGVDPTGPLPLSIDFPLRRSPEPDAFEALLIADPQPQNARELSYLRDDLASLVLRRSAAFALVHGDIAFDDLALYPRYLDLIATTGIPWHHCPGNHDMNGEATDTRFAYETWKRTFGPCHYAFQYGRATFILLSNVICTPGGERRYGAAIPRDQLAFVRNVLAHTPRDRLVVLSMHIPLKASSSVADPVPDVAGARELLHLLSGHPHTVSFSGHTHTAEHHYLGRDEGFDGPQPHHHHVLATASGSWWSGPADRRGVPFADCQDGSPRGLHTLQVDGNSYRTRLVPAAADASAVPVRFSVAAEGRSLHRPIARSELGACRLVANVYDGGPRTKLTCEISGRHGAPLAMQREPIADPEFAALFASAPGAYKSWVEPIPSTHVWTAPLPLDLAPGAYRIRLNVTDEYGQRYGTDAVVEIVADEERTIAAVRA